MRNLRRFPLVGVCVVAVLAGTSSTADSAATAGSAPRSPYIVVLKNRVDASSVAAAHARKYGANVSLVYTHALKGYAATLSPEALAAVDADPNVLFTERDRELVAAASADLPTGDATVCGPHRRGQEQRALGRRQGVRAGERRRNSTAASTPTTPT